MSSVRIGLSTGERAITPQTPFRNDILAVWSSTSILAEKFPPSLSRTEGVSTCEGRKSLQLEIKKKKTYRLKKKSHSRPFGSVVALQREQSDASYLTSVTPPSLPGWAASRSARHRGRRRWPASRGSSGRTAPSRWPPPGRGCRRRRPAPPRRRPVTSGPRRPRWRHRWSSSPGHWIWRWCCGSQKPDLGGRERQRRGLYRSPLVHFTYFCMYSSSRFFRLFFRRCSAEGEAAAPHLTEFPSG